MPRLKIAFLSRWLWEENRRLGAGGGMAQQLAEAVAARGHEVVALSQSPQVLRLGRSVTNLGSLETWLSPRERRRGPLSGLRDKLLKTRFHHRKVWSDALDLRQFLALRGPFDLVWAQTEEPDGLVAAIAARHDKHFPPILTQIHSLRICFADGRPVFTDFAALGLAFRRATRLIANSEMIARDLAVYARAARLSAGALAAKTSVTFPNVVTEILAAAAPEFAPSPAEPRRIVFLGALNEIKGAIPFLQAAVHLKLAGADAVFVVLGNFTEKNTAFEQRWLNELGQARRQLASWQIEVLGKVPPGEAIRQVRRAALVVVPSLYDPFSRAAAEAVLLGLPIVTTERVGFAPWIAEHACGRVVPPGDAVALARAMEAILAPNATEPLRARTVAPKLQQLVSPTHVALALEKQFLRMVRPPER